MKLHRTDVPDYGNAEQVRILAPVSDVQVSGTADGTPADALNTPQISERADGFALLDADGAVLDWHPCILDACDAFKARKLARRIVRVADGCVMRFRVCKAKASRYEEARAA